MGLEEKYDGGKGGEKDGGAEWSGNKGIGIKRRYTGRRCIG